MPFFLFLLIVIALGMALGLVGMILQHQREMANLGRGREDARVQALERRVDSLTEIVHQQAIALDSLHRATPEDAIRQRVGT